MITLSGTVPTPDEKEQAASVAKQTAPNYTIADEIAVVSPGSAGSDQGRRFRYRRRNQRSFQSRFDEETPV